MLWTPLPGPEDEDAGKELMDVESEDDLIGKPWTYRWVGCCRVAQSSIVTGEGRICLIDSFIVSVID